MAKIKNRGYKFVNKLVGDEEEIDRIMREEFNPVKEKKLEEVSAKELLESFVEYFAADERQPQECITTFLDLFENGRVRESGIKKTSSYDRSRLEFLRMQIGPVQNFYTTLGNILLSVIERMVVLELMVENLKKQLDNLEGKQSENKKSE